MPKINLDMTNAEGFPVVPEGDYICKVAKAEVKDSSKGSKYIAWEILIGTGPNKGQKLFHNTSLLPQALFNLRNFLMGCGVNVPKSVMTLDTDTVIGKIVGVTVGHEEYKGKPKAQCVDFFTVVKTTAGWTRAVAAASKKVVDEPEDDIATNVSTSSITDDVEEIDI